MYQRLGQVITSQRYCEMQLLVSDLDTLSVSDLDFGTQVIKFSWLSSWSQFRYISGNYRSKYWTCWWTLLYASRKIGIAIYDNLHISPPSESPRNSCRGFRVIRYLQPSLYDDVIKWKHFPRYWPSVRGIHRSPVNSSHKGQWRGGLEFPLICVWINGWVNNREAGDLRRYRVHYDVIVMLVKHIAT